MPRRLAELVGRAPDRPGLVTGLLGRLGAAIRGRLGRPVDPRADRRVGAVVLLVVGLGVVVPPLAVLVGAAAAAGSVLRRRRAARRAHDALVEELPEVVDLLWLSVGAGLTVPLALGVVERHGVGRLADELARARRRSEMGQPLAETIEEIPRRLGDVVRPVTSLLAGSLRDGTPLAGPLERVAADVRIARRRAAEERARRVSVRLLFPLVFCVLPAFALLTVVPLLAGALRGLSI